MRRLLLLVFVMLAIPLTTAHAQAELVVTEPEVGAELSESPSQVRAVFSEPITSESTLIVTDAQGRIVADGSRIDSADPSGQTLLLELDTLAAGNYTVSWFSVNANDLSLAEGEWQFTVASNAAVVATSTTAATSATAANTTVAINATATTVRTATPRPSPTPRPTTPAVATVARPTVAVTVATTSPAGGVVENAPPSSAGAGVSSVELPNTASGAPTPWMFGGLAALGALTIWAMRRRL